MKLFNFYRKSASIPLFILLCLIISINGCGRRETVPPEADIPEVAVLEVKAEKVVVTEELPGRTHAYLVAEVRPRVGGIIIKRFFEEGADVKENEVLYEIDSAPYQAVYNKCKAELARAEAMETSLKEKYERNKNLVKTRNVSQQDYEESEAGYFAAEAEIESCKAALQSARINLDYTMIKAPISGRIGKSDITVGSLVVVFDPKPLAIIQQIDPIFVNALQSSVDLLKYKKDVQEGYIKKSDDKSAKVKLYFEDDSVYPLEGELKFRDISVDQTTGSFILRILFPNPNLAILPGMYVHVLIEIGEVENAILVTHQAVKRNFKGEPIAYVVDSSGKVEERKLTIECSMDYKWLIKEGLKPGDKLIVEGFQRIRPGVSVKAVNFEKNHTDTPIVKEELQKQGN